MTAFHQLSAAEVREVVADAQRAGNRDDVRILATRQLLDDRWAHTFHYARRTTEEDYTVGKWEKLADEGGHTPAFAVTVAAAAAAVILAAVANKALREARPYV